MGKAIVIKGADFSKNAVQFNTITNLLYDSVDDGYQVYNGNPNPVPNTNGLAMYITSKKKYRLAHFANSLVTDNINVEGFTNFSIHSKCTLTSPSNPMIGIAFYNLEEVPIKIYTTTYDEQLSDMIIDLLPSKDWYDITGNIPEETVSMRAVYSEKPNELLSYQDFKLQLF